MTRPTDWRTFATGLVRRPSKKPGFKHEGINSQSLRTISKTPLPGCYIFGIKRPTGRGDPHTVYVGMAGENQGLYKRILRHSNRDNATAYFITNCLRNEYHIYFRYFVTNTEEEAEAMERNSLKQWWKFPWNAAGTPARPRKT